MTKKDELSQEDYKIIKEICEENKLEFKKYLGKGAFGVVVKANEKNNPNKAYAIKIIFLNKLEKGVNYEEYMEFRGQNIVKIMGKKTDLEKCYHYYIMECSELGSLSSLKNDLINIENSKISGDSFLEKVGNNLLRFFAKQIIKGIKTFYEGNLVHFDIKPNNILIFQGMQIKLIDFSFLMPIKKDQDLIRGGTPGYVTPEYYLGNKLEKSILNKQDYFAIGVVLYYLKYGEKMLNYVEEKSEKLINKGYINSTMVVDLISIAINKIKSKKYQDKSFTDFLISLIQYKPEDRPEFEKIYRNKWLNKNSQEIKKINDIYSSDEGNMVFELQKSDFLIEHKKYFDIDNKDDINKYKIVKKGKFKFLKKK